MLRCLTSRLIAAVAALVVALVGDAAAQCPDGSPPPCSAPRRVAAATQPVAPPAVAARRRTFLVLPFRNLTRSPDHDWLVEGSPVLISDALSRNDSLMVVPDERLYPAMERAGLEAGEVMDLGRVRRVAQETGGWTAVTGEIMALGNRLRVSARAFDVVTNTEVLRAVEEAAADEDVRGIYERLGTRLVRVTGMGREAANLATITTRSVDAYRAYVRGVVHQNRSEVRRARDAFREAVGLDSTYAQAYARLAETEINTDPRQVTQPQSPLYRYSARAAALAANLPPRDREVVLAMNDYLSGRFSSARGRVEKLLADDSLHVDALERMSGIEMFDPILVQRGAGRRPRGSMNKGLALAKRALELDPSRHQLYGSQVQAYLLASGMAPGFTLGFEREAASLPALLSEAPAMSFVLVLRDTIELVPTDSMGTVPADTLAAARARAVDAARQWVTRWLEAGKGQAEPHLWASRVHSQAGDYEAALRELNAADAIGVETGLDNVPARRMSLLANLGRYAEGRAIAESLSTAGAFINAAQNAYAIEGAGWAYTLFVLDGQHAAAETLLQQFSVAFAPAAAMSQELAPESMAALILGGAIRQFFSPPASVRLSVVERLLADAGSLPAGSTQRRTLPFQAWILVRDTAVSRPALVGALVSGVQRLKAAGDEDMAFRVAVVAARDTAGRRTLEGIPWYDQRRAAVQATRAANANRFRPVRAVVTDSTASFHWTVTDGPFHWNLPENMAAADFGWEATFTADGGEYEVMADVNHRPGSAPASGDLAALVRAAATNLHQIVSADSTVPHRTLNRTTVRVELEPVGMRLVLRDPRLVSALRRERPATVRMEFRPCDGTCAQTQVPVTYP